MKESELIASGLAIAETVIEEEPELPGPMPFRLRIYAMLFPEQWSREVVQLTKQGIAKRVAKVRDRFEAQ
jgi:hypothetical protein